MLDPVNLKKSTNYEYRKLDTTPTDRINTLLLATDWSPLQPLHINDQFDFVNNKLLEYINICAPIKVAKIPAKYVARENWMTQGLLQSSLNLHKLRKKETGKMNSNLYKSYRNLYNRLVRIVKAIYYIVLGTAENFVPRYTAVFRLHTAVCTAVYRDLIRIYKMM